MSRRRDPEPETAEPTVETSKRARAKVVARRDELGRPIEVVEVTDPVAASHWGAEDWRPVR
jgi:hypothetical protein